MGICIDRCLCFRLTFAELQQIAAEKGSRSLEELQKHVVFGQKCKLCHPYVRKMLKTGETVFYQILSEQDV